MSIRLRLTLWYVSLLAIILIIFSGALYTILSYSSFTEVDRRLEIRASEVNSALSTALEVQTEPRVFILRGGRLTLPTADTFATPGVFVQISTLDGVAVTRSENLGDQTLAVSAAALIASAKARPRFVSWSWISGSSIRSTIDLALVCT